MNNEYVIPSKPSIPSESDNLGVLVNKVKEVDTYTNALRTELINIDNNMIDLNGDGSVSKLPLDATLTQAIEKNSEIGTVFSTNLNTVKSTADSALNKANVNESSISNLQAEVGTNRSKLITEINNVIGKLV